MSRATTTPSIRIYDSGAHHSRFSLPHRSSSYGPSAAIPMPIPNARNSPPPPLPPPRNISELHEGQDPGWHWGNPPNGPDVLVAIRQGSSLLGGSGQVKRDKSAIEGGAQNELGLCRRGGSISTITTDMNPKSLDRRNDDRAGLTRPSLANHRLQSEQQLGRRALETSSQAYDKQLLSKIGGPNTPTRSSGPGFLTSSAQEASPSYHGSFSKLNGQLKPLSVPDRRYTSLGSPGARWPSSGAVSPAQSGFRSPILDPNPSDRRICSVSASGYDDSAPRSQRGSYDQGIFMEQDFSMEENGIRELNINDRSPSGSEDYQMGSKLGVKRRATSPPADPAREDRAAGGDLFHRRSTQMLNTRNSRFHASHGSVSSSSSIGQRTGSYASSLGLSMASSNTNYSELFSPRALSPSVETDFGTASPYGTSRSLNPSPRTSISRVHHQRGPSETETTHNRKMSSDSLPHSRQNSVSKNIGVFICECCPKKPKKFDNAEELRVHELEKQYTCLYCPNRFKNKNEAERHQNSLHLRRHSWSCAALAGVHAAFHSSTVHPNAADVCGYCGEEFSNPANWDVRADHLNHVHKFGECNQAKKFYRADHFRQHLKHSHAGTSGKWTNMLENACMKDEPPPKERLGSVGSLGQASAAGGGGASATVSGAKPSVIDEAHDES